MLLPTIPSTCPLPLCSWAPAPVSTAITASPPPSFNAADTHLHFSSSLRMSHAVGHYATFAPGVSSSSFRSPVGVPPPSNNMYDDHHFPSATPMSSLTTPTQQTPAQSPSLISRVNSARHHHCLPFSSTIPYWQNYKQHACHSCHKAFSRPASLRIHSHSHTGEKPFRCTYEGCDRAFSVRGNGNRHERIVHGGRSVFI
jgi:uncharacterized Zn-finger protein